MPFVSDLDSGAGTDAVGMNAIALPGAGGAVVGGTATNPLNVVVASGGTGTIITTPSTASVAAETQVAVTAVAGIILVASAARKGYVIENTGMVDVRIGFVGTITTTTGFLLAPNDAFGESPATYTGPVYAIAASATNVEVAAW